MKIKALALGGAALFLATAAYASQPPSSAAERAQTQQLNAQSLQAAQQGQAPSNSQSPSTSQSPTTSQNQTSDTSGANGNMAANDSASASPAAAPTPQVAQNNMTPASATPLSAMANPPPALNTASVVDSSGATVGAVQKVEVATSGAPLRVDVALTGQSGHVVAIEATNLTYDSSTNVLTARASADQIKAMPSAPQS